jgi:hypothetical protein
LLAVNTDEEDGLQALSNQIPHKVEFYKMQTSNTARAYNSDGSVWHISFGIINPRPWTFLEICKPLVTP